MMANDDSQGQQPNCAMTAAQQRKASQLSAEQLAEVDAILLHQLTQRWQKQAKIIGQAMAEMPHEYNGLPDVFYSQRLKALLEQRQLMLMGDINHMRFSELKLRD